MKLQVYSVYDHKTEVFHAPNYFHNDGHALRELSMVLGKPNTAFTQYPEDFSIYQVGTFEDSKGLLQPQEPVRLVSSVTALINSLTEG